MCFHEDSFTCSCEKENKKVQKVSNFALYWSFSNYITAVKGLVTWFGPKRPFEKRCPSRVRGSNQKPLFLIFWGFCASLSFSNEPECTLIECNCYASVLLATRFYSVLMILLGSAGFSIVPPSPPSRMVGRVCR